MLYRRILTVKFSSIEPLVAFSQKIAATKKILLYGACFAVVKPGCQAPCKFDDGVCACCATCSFMNIFTVAFVFSLYVHVQANTSSFSLAGSLYSLDPLLGRGNFDE